MSAFTPRAPVTVVEPSTYTLPIASLSTLGGVKVGTGLTIDGNGVLTVDALALGFDFEDISYPTSLKIGAPTHIDTLQEIHNHVASSGVMHGCDLTNNGDGTVSLSSGIAMLRASADPHTALYAIEVSAQASIALTDNATNYISLNYNGGSPVFTVSTSITSFNCLDICIAYVVHRSGTALNWVDAREQNVDGNRKSRQLFLKFSRFIHAENGTALGASGLAITVTAGSFFFMLAEQVHPAFDTSVAGTANENVFKLWYRDGAGGWTSTANQKLITTTTYDDNSGTLATMANNKYGVTWFYVAHNTPSSLHAIVGQQEYADLASARVATPPSSVPSIVSGLGSLIGFVIYQKSAVAFAAIQSAFTQTFGSSAATIHNGLSGLQGGAVNDYYHLTSAQHTIAIQAASSTLSGYLSSTDWNTFNNKQPAGSYEVTSAKGAANGYAPLGADSKIPSAYIPALAITEYLGNFADTTAALANGTVQASQKGDWFTVSTSGGQTWIVTTDSPTLLAHITKIASPTDVVTSVNGQTGVISLAYSDLTSSAINIGSNTLTAGRATFSDQITFTSSASIVADTSDGADDQYVSLGGGGAANTLRGACITMFGNEYAGVPGYLRLYSGTVTGAKIALGAEGAEQLLVSAAALTTTSAVTSLAFQAGNPSLNIGTGALTAGSGAFSSQNGLVVGATNKWYSYDTGTTTYWTDTASGGGNGIAATSGADVKLRVGGNNIATVSSTGLAVTGASSATGDVTAGSGGNNGKLALGNQSGSYYGYVYQDAGTTGKMRYNSYAASGSIHGHQWEINGTANMTLDASGNLLVRTTSQLNAGSVCVLNDATHNGYVSKDSGSSNALYVGSNSGGTVVFNVAATGNVTNTNNSYGAISDIKLKNILGPAPSYWDKFKRYEFVNYTLKSDESNTKLLGLVAQQAQTVSAGVVESSPDRDQDCNDLGTETLGVKYSVVTLQAEVVLQEAQERIESLETVIQELTTRIQQLESK